MPARSAARSSAVAQPVAPSSRAVAMAPAMSSVVPDIVATMHAVPADQAAAPCTVAGAWVAYGQR